MKYDGLRARGSGKSLGWRHCCGSSVGSDERSQREGLEEGESGREKVGSGKVGKDEKTRGQ